LRAEVQRIQAEHDGLAARFAEGVASRDDARGRLQESIAKLTEMELALGRARAEARQLQVAKEQLESRLGAAGETGAGAETRLREAVERFVAAEDTITLLRQDAAAAAEQRAELEARLSEAVTARSQLETSVAQTQAAHIEAQARLQSADDVRAALESEIQTLRAELGARQRPATPFVEQPAGATHAAAVMSSSRIQQEILQVQAKLNEIMRLIDDPAAALTTVMRKSLEKSEMEWYLKGITFATNDEQPS
jgi:chromosome segregation ATPase